MMSSPEGRYSHLLYLLLRSANLTDLDAKLESQLASGESTSPRSITQGTSRSSIENHQEQLNAFMYIIVVLGVYSFGVLYMLCMYIKQEESDYEDERVIAEYHKFVENQHSNKSKIRLGMLNTSFSQNGTLPCLKTIREEVSLDGAEKDGENDDNDIRLKEEEFTQKFQNQRYSVSRSRLFGCSCEFENNSSKIIHDVDNEDYDMGSQEGCPERKKSLGCSNNTEVVINSEIILNRCDNKDEGEARKEKVYSNGENTDGRSLPTNSTDQNLVCTSDT